MEKNKKITCLFLGAKDLDNKLEELEIPFTENSKEFTETSNLL